MPNISSLVKKQIITETLLKLKKKLIDDNHDKCITTPEFNELTVENFAARLKQANFVTKTDSDDKLINQIIQKINSNKTKHLLVSYLGNKTRANIKDSV